MNGVAANLHEFWKAFLGLIYPAFCLICKERLAPQDIDARICPCCWAKATRNMPPFCAGCGRTLDQNAGLALRCSRCRDYTYGFDRATSPFAYEGVIKELIHQFKYGRREYLGRTLATAMVCFIREYALPMDSVDILIPIPLHPARLRQREFNQAYVLAQEIGAAFGIPVLKHALMRRRNTRTQTDLEAPERFANVRGSFLAGDTALIQGKNIMLVDDVLTTGATASEAADTLKQSGGKTVWVMTLAN